MYIANVTNDYDNITSSNYIAYDNITSFLDNSTLCNCTNDDNNIEIIIPLFTIIPCAMSLIFLISLMVYTLIKLLFNKK